MKSVFSMGVLIFSLIFLAACSDDNDNLDASAENIDTKSEEKVVLKMGNITKDTNALSLTLYEIGEELSARTDGRITAQYFPAGQLGNEGDMLQQLNTGSLDMGIITTAQLSNSSVDFSAWLMPFIVDNHAQAFELSTSEESMALFDTLTSENVKGLGYSTSGFRYLLSTKPIVEANDLNGFKIRTTPSPTILDFWNSLKSGPTPMPLTEVYTSLQTGVIDGVDIDSESVVTENLTEIAKHLTPSKHMYWIGGVLMNNDLWDSFSKDDQELIQEIVTEKTKKISEQTAQNEKELLENGADAYGITIHELKDISEFDPYIEEVQKIWLEKSPGLSGFLKKSKEIRSK